MGRGNHTARSKYATWWNKKRVSEGFKLEDILELWEGNKPSESHLYSCLGGQKMPSDLIIQNISNIFDVPFDEAKSHFFNDWCGSKSKNPVKIFSSPEEKTVKVDAEWIDDQEIRKEEVMDHHKTGMLDRESMLKKVYGIVDFDTYLIIDEALLVGSSKDVLKNIYGKISFDAYQEVLKCL